VLLSAGLRFCFEEDTGFGLQGTWETAFWRNARLGTTYSRVRSSHVADFAHSAAVIDCGTSTFKAGFASQRKPEVSCSGAAVRLRMVRMRFLVCWRFLSKKSELDFAQLLSVFLNFGVSFPPPARPGRASY
jgi:hypothetical protein